jgi:uncharacterized membrane-anchored protein YhcB (DUF1043 family)
MERLALCSKILYDYDILEKQKRINELEKKLENPKMRFETYEEWEKYKEKIFEDIGSVLKKCIEDDEFEYHHMSHLGITFRQEDVIRDCIYSNLHKCTKNSFWSEKITDDVMHSLNAMINTLQDVNLWGYIHETQRSKGITELVYKHITWFLGDGTHSTTVLDELPEFECKKCHKIEDFITEKNLCFSCDKH